MQPNQPPMLLDGPPQAAQGQPPLGNLGDGQPPPGPGGAPFAQQINIAIPDGGITNAQEMGNLFGQVATGLLQSNANLCAYAETASRTMDGLHHAHSQLGTHVSAIATSMQRDSATASEAVRAHSAAATEERQATAQHIASTNAHVQALAQQTQDAVNKLAEAQRQLAAALAQQAAHQPQAPGAAHAHPGPAAHADARIGEALTAMVALMAEQQGTRAQKIACTHSHFEELVKQLGVLAVRAGGADIDKVHNAVSVVGLIFEKAYPNRAFAQQPAVPDLVDAEKQWHCEDLRTLQRQLLLTKEIGLASAMERDAVQQAVAPFFKQAKFTAKWFEPRRAPAPAPADGQPRNPRNPRAGQQPPQQQPFLQPQYLVAQPPPLNGQQPPRQQPTQPHPKKAGKNAGTATD